MKKTYFAIHIPKDFIGFLWFRDRIGLNISFRITWRFELSIAIHPAMWAGVLYIFRRRLWIRPIDYAAIERWRRAV